VKIQPRIATARARVPRWDWGAYDIGITTRATGEDDDGRPGVRVSGCPGVRAWVCERTDGRTDDALVWDFISFVRVFRVRSFRLI
jgi:hypothetical protein